MKVELKKINSFFVAFFLLSIFMSEISAKNVKFESTEGWAMAYMASASLNLATTPKSLKQKGNVRLSAELSSIPKLSKEQQIIGLGGAKEEDLNKSPIFGRVNIEHGIPFGLTLELSWTPAFEINGAKPKNLWGLAISYPIILKEYWGLEARIFSQNGVLIADVTCSHKNIKFVPFTEGNLYGCIGPSNDKLKLDHIGLEAIVKVNRTFFGMQPWLSYASTRMDSSVEINAPLAGGDHQAYVSTNGTLNTFSFGLLKQLNDKLGINIGSSYTPLKVQRKIQSKDSDSFWNIKMSVYWSF